MSLISCRGDYDEVRRLGHGSFGRVDLVRRGTCGTHYVIRQHNVGLIRHEFRDEPATAIFVEKRIRAQAGLMMSLLHSNIVRVVCSFEEKVVGDDVIHIVAEYFSGGNLENAINEKKPFAESELCSWAKQLVMALQFLHSHGIAHRDLRTQNIFLLSERRFLKLGELGCCESFTQLGTMDRLKLLPYVPPEVLSRSKFSRKGDSWMLGIVIYRLATFKFPFSEQESRTFKDHVINGTPLPISKRYSSEMREFVRHLLRKAPPERPTMALLLAESHFLNRPIASEGYMDMEFQRIKESSIPEQHKIAICSAMQTEMLSADMLAHLDEDRIKQIFPEMGLQLAVKAWQEEDANMSQPSRLMKAAGLGDIEILKRIISVFGGDKMVLDPCVWEQFDGETPLIRAARYGQLEVVEFLLSDDVKAPIAARNHVRNMAIHEAITNNHTRVVDSLLLHDPRLLEEVGEFGWTPLMRAAALGKLDCVQLLMRRCANPTAGANLLCEDMAIHLACYFGRGEVVQYILNVLPNLIDKKNSVGVMPIFRAAAGGHASVVNLIISQGGAADPFSYITPRGGKDSFYYSPIHEAAAYGHLDTIKLLIKYGADANRRSRSMNTRGMVLGGKKSGSLPIHFAAENGHLHVVQYLLTLNGDFMEEKNARGCSPLSLAVSGGHTNLAKFLLEHRADPESTDHLHKTPLIYAATYGYVEIVKMLLRYGASIYARSRRATPVHSLRQLSDTSNQDTPTSIKLSTTGGRSRSPSKDVVLCPSTSKTSMAVHHAAENLQFEVVKCLLTHNVGLLEVKDSLGKSPLACAISCDKRALSIVPYLLSLKASTETRDSRGWTPLHQAAHIGAVELVDLLIKHRANIYALTNSGDMAIHLAVGAGKLAIVRLLLDERPDLFGAKNKRDNTPFRQAVKDRSSHSDVVRFLRHWETSQLSPAQLDYGD